MTRTPLLPPDAVTRRLTQVERAYSLVLGLRWFATMLPGAVLVLFAQSRGLSLADIGLYIAVYGVTVALLELPTGNLADVAGRKRVTLVAYGLSALAMFSLLFAFSLPAFLVYAVVSGLARALGSGALEAWFVNTLRDLDPDVNLQPRLARVNTIELLALGSGALIGAGLPTLSGRGLPTGTELFSPLAWGVAASGVMYLVTLGVAWRVIDETPQPDASVLGALREGLFGLPTALRQAGQSLRQDALLPWLLTLQAVTGLMLAATETYWQPFFAGRFGLGGSSTLVFGMLLAGCFLAGMLGNLCAERLVRLVGQRVARLGVLTQTVQALALLALAWQGSVWLAALLLWLTYFARTAFSSSFLTLYNGQVPNERRSLMLSVLSVALFLGFSLGGVVLGAISSRWSVSWAWTLVAGVLLLSTGVFLKLSGKDHPAGAAPVESVAREAEQREC